MSETDNARPPLGIVPKLLWIEHRLQAIAQTMERQTACGAYDTARDLAIEYADLYIGWVKAKNEN